MRPKPTLFLPSGVIRDRDLSKVEPFDPAKVTEYVTHSWYQYQRGDQAALHPFQGETQPELHGAQAAVRAARHRQEVLAG